jgi:hypothetical protein
VRGRRRPAAPAVRHGHLAEQLRRPRLHEGLGPAGAGFGREISLSRLLADIEAGRRSDDIKAIKKALNRELGAGLKGGGRFGTKTRAAYSQWQQKLGFAGSVARVGSNADGQPGADSLERLGFLVVA